MERKTITIDIDRLRKDLASDSYAGGVSGMPAMLVEAWDIERASNEKLVELARKKGIDLEDYEV
ncbi:MAG: hypothetical protein II488_01585 [Firmicutes bacterium]|nr:hypothetical protein [Bacillota bacterium]